jgi:RNA polymerase sigma factor (sigma-70 family)
VSTNEPPRDPSDDLARALAGDRAAAESLVRALMPVVQVRVYGALAARRGAARSRDIRQEVEDLTQEVLMRVFADDMRVLRSWDAARGLSLKGFVGLVSEREVGHVLKSARRSPFTADPTDVADLERAAGSAHGPESALASRQNWDRVWERLKSELTPKGHELFRLIVLEERTVEEVSRELGMQPDAVYDWRSRLTKRIRAAAESVGAIEMSEKDSARATGKEGPS